MKYLFVIVILSILLVSCFSFALAEQERNQEREGNEVDDENEFEDEKETELGDDGAVPTLISANPNSEKNMRRAMIGHEEIETELEIEESNEDNQTRLRVQLSNGRRAEIKFMPETAGLRARERLGELNFSIQLEQVGQGNDTRLMYEVQAERHYRILALFRTKAQVKAEVDAETGELVSVKKPWWAFLATSSD